MRDSLRGTGAVLALGVTLFAPGAVFAAGNNGAPLAATPHFALHSDIATNLNDALVVAGSARNDGKPELFHAGSEEGPCFAELPRRRGRAGTLRSTTTPGSSPRSPG